jgi:2-hydroxymuconate-semialdehyde hydrolase
MGRSPAFSQSAAARRYRPHKRVYDVRVSDSPRTEALPGERRPIDGVDVYRVVHGTGRPLVFLHGIPTSSYLWRNVQRALGDRYQTIAVDLVGMGQSGCPGDRSWRLDAQAEMVRKLLDQLGLDKVVLVGHDIGGAVAHHFVARHPDRVSAQVVMNIAAFAESWPVPLVAAMRLPLLGDLLSAAPSKPLLRREMKRGVYHQNRIDDELFDHYYRPLSTFAGRRAFLRFVRGFDPPAAEADLRATSTRPIPRLILWGERDIFQPLRYGERLHDLWPNSTFIPIPQAGHFLQEDQPDRIAAEIRTFLG